VQGRPGRRPAPRLVADTGPEEGSRGPLLGAVQQYNARKTALAEEADCLKRVTLRPKVSHRLPLIRVADAEKKAGLSLTEFAPCAWWFFLVLIYLITYLMR
jgi:hypothetical protein